MTSTIAQISPRELIAMLRPEFRSPDTGVGAPGYNAEEGRLYWDITNHRLYINDSGGAGWTLVGTVSGTGANTQVTYWTGTLTIAGDAGWTYNAATDTFTLAGGMILTGGANATITVNDNAADVLGIEDAGGIEYLKIISTDAQPIVRFNDGGVDVDFYVEAVGVADALVVRGSDGRITLGALGAGTVITDAGGNLSVAAGVPPAAHNILSASHGDSVVNAVTRGSLIYGNATPAWDELNHPGGANRVLQSAAADVQWSAQTLTLTTSLTNQGANGILNWGGAFTLTIPATGTAVLGGGSGANTRVAYWTDANTISSDAGFTYNAGTDTITLAGGITLTGGANATIVVNDNAADVLGIEDAGGLEYLKIISTDAQPITRFNDGGADIDFYVEAVGVADALFIRGSDGQFTVGALGAGFVRSDAGGVLSSSALVAGDLPAHTHSGAGQGGSLAVGTTDTDATPGSVFFAGGAGVIQEDNTEFFWDDTNNFLGIGDNTPSGHLTIYNNAVNTTVTYYGVYNYHIKTLGATDASDDLYGIYNYVSHNDSSETFGELFGIYSLALCDSGVATSDVNGALIGAQVDGASVDDLIGAFVSSVGITGTVRDDIFGEWIYVSAAAGMTDVVGDMYGVYIEVYDSFGAGTVYGIYIASGTNNDYGIYQAGTADNYFAGAVGIGDATPDAPLDVYHATTDIVAFFESGDDIGGIEVKDDTTTAYLYAADGNVYLGGDAAKALTNLHIDVSTGYISSGIAPGNLHLDIYDATLTSTATFYGIRSYHIKTAGAGAVGDDYFGIYSLMSLEQATTIDNLWGIQTEAKVDDGVAIADIAAGGYFIANIDDGAITNVYGLWSDVFIDETAGTTIGTVYGSRIRVDASSGTVTTIYGHHIQVDDDLGATTVYMLYLNELTGIDYGIYQNGSAYNYLGGHTSIGNDANYTTRHFQVYDNAITTTDDYYGAYLYHQKTAGITDASDDLMGIYNSVTFNQAAGVLGDVVGTYSHAIGTNGTSANQYGAEVFAQINGGTVNTVIYGLSAIADLDSGTVADVIGVYAGVDIESTMSSVTGDVSGLYVSVDDDEGAGGTVYMVFLEEQSGIDYGVWQNGSSPNRLGGTIAAVHDDYWALEDYHASAPTADGYVRVDINGTTYHLLAYAPP